MKKKDNVLIRPPDTFPTIYIQHGSPPVFSYQSKPFKNRAQGFEPNTVKNDIWMTHPIDAILPVATPNLIAPALAKTLPTPNRVFSDIVEKSKRETQEREDKAQVDAISPMEVPGLTAAPALAKTLPTPNRAFSDIVEKSKWETQAREDKAQVDAISPMEALGLTAAPALAEALPPPNRAFSDIKKENQRETLTKEDEAQEELIADINDAPACVHVDGDPPAPIVQALVSDVSAGLCSSPYSSPPPEPRQSSEASRIVRGLLQYKKWWFLREVGISVEGKMLTGTPIFMHEDTLRVVNDTYSYFIPMDNVDYIRTPDGLAAARMEFEESPFCEC